MSEFHGPRNGLQNEKHPIGVDTKVGLVERLVDAGVRHIEAASFVSPKRVPQMVGSAYSFAGTACTNSPAAALSMQMAASQRLQTVAQPFKISHAAHSLFL